MLELCEVLDGPMLEQNPEKKKTVFFGEFFHSMWLNAGQRSPLLTICGAMWGALRAFSGPQYFSSTPLQVKSLCMRFLSLCLCQPFPPSGWVLVSIRKLLTEFSV